MGADRHRNIVVEVKNKRGANIFIFFHDLGFDAVPVLYQALRFRVIIEICHKRILFQNCFNIIKYPCDNLFNSLFVGNTFNRYRAIMAVVSEEEFVYGYAENRRIFSGTQKR